MSKEDLKNVNAIKFANKENKTQNRWKSKVVWGSIVLLILPILGHLGVYEKFGITEDYLKTVIDGIFNVLVLVGVLNNPSDSEKF